MYLNQVVSFCLAIAVISTSGLHLAIRYSENWHQLQQKPEINEDGKKTNGNIICKYIFKSNAEF